MRHIHATFLYLMTYVRIVGIFAISLLLIFLFPYLGDGPRAILKDALNYLGFLYAILMGFLMSIAIQRRRALDEHISQELSKIRRIYHIALHMTKDSPKLAPWFKALTENLQAYLTLFRSVSFAFYEHGNPLFRNVTYTIYGLPSKKLKYNAELYHQLLEASSLVTNARQYIRAIKDQYIGYFQWTVIFIVTLTFSWILAASTPNDPAARFMAVMVIFNILLVQDLLYEYDRLNDKKLHYLADLYAMNLSDVEPYRKIQGVERDASR